MIPCKDCITLPICRRKEYSVMLRNCSLLSELLYKIAPMSPKNRKNTVFNREIYGLERILKPTRWKVVTGPSGYITLNGVGKK